MASPGLHRRCPMHPVHHNRRTFVNARQCNHQVPAGLPTYVHRKKHQTSRVNLRPCHAASDSHRNSHTSPSTNPQDPLAPGFDDTSAHPSASSASQPVSGAGEQTASGDAQSLAATSNNAEPTEYKSDLAKGFIAPEGEPPLWFVEKFEARRKALAEQASVANQQPTASSVQPEPAPSPPPKPKPSPRDIVAAAVQLVQLTMVTAALVLWPATLIPGGIYTLRIWILWLGYWVFFALGTMQRMLNHGSLAPQSQDRQRTSSWQTRMALVLFIMAMPLLHWYPVIRYIRLGLYFSDVTLYEVLGTLATLLAIWLNRAAAKELGAAYDRLVAPGKLVTSGVYRWVQHPIYTSYMLLFFGFGMVLHSAPCALLMLAICLIYYHGRTALERQILQETFGYQYEQYCKSTKKFIPFLV